MIAHVVGGAAVLAAFNSGAAQLGARNADIARDMLRSYKIPIVSTETGGRHGRKLLFSPRDGSISVQLIGV
jgi:chemotaxis receptor (MCP) glutamine deamidase CheD